MTVPLADYQAQQDAFCALFEPMCGANILLFSGSSGSGKTTLVKTCLDTVPGYITCISVNLRGSANTL